MTEASHTFDYGAPDYKLPDARDLRPVDAARLMDDIERASTETNARKKRLDGLKSQVRNLVIEVLKDNELDSVRFTNSAGRKVQYTPYTWDVYNVTDEAAFREWAAGEAERFYGEALREGVFLDEMRARAKAGEPIPPGVSRFTDMKLSRSAATGK